MVIDVSTETELDALSELLVDAGFREGVFHQVKGELVFTCEVIRAVPDKAEEYWMGPIHRTRIPWIKCVIEFSGVTRCQVKEWDESSAEGQMLLAWGKHGGHYLISIRTPYRMEFQFTLRHLAGRCEDVGELIWQK